MRALDGPEVVVRTGAWYAEQPFCMRFPAGWEVTTLWPRTPPPLSEAGIGAALERPLGQAPLRHLFRGKTRPLIIVDDLNRPTPAARVLPHLLRHLWEAGIPSHQVTILMATGMHGQPPADALARKVGPEAAALCRLLVHDAMGPVAKLGPTSFGTPVYVNRELLAADLVIGLGGASPSGNTGFGGGSKLMLGVLGAPTIVRLHSFHPNIPWGVFDPQCSFRLDLDEIADMVKLASLCIAHVDANRELVRLACGGFRQVFLDAAAFSQQAFSAPLPSADVVVCNAYPSDVSLFFAQAKGTHPLAHCPPRASRILVAACSEGQGCHHLFSAAELPLTQRARLRAVQLRVLSPGAIIGKLVRRLRPTRRLHATARQRLRPTWLYRPGQHVQPLSLSTVGMETQTTWAEILQRVQAEQGNRTPLQVVVYPCSSLQCLTPPPGVFQEAADLGEGE